MAGLYVLWSQVAHSLNTPTTESQNAEFNQEITLEFRQFAEPSVAADHNQDGSLSWQGRYVKQWRNAQGNLTDELSIVPFIRYNSNDPERSRFDLQAASWTAIRGDWEIRSGIRSITWQTTESIHLVDIVNQTDLTGDVDGEDKLGQTMINLLWRRDWGNIELFVLPGFRERIFPGSRARLRGNTVIENDDARYESSAEELHTDIAIRTTLFLADWEVAFSHFAGTSREPLLLFKNNRLLPFYPVIDQTGIELQYAAGDWLWKIESISRSGFHTNDSVNTQAGRYEAAAAGFEFTWSGLGETGYDFGLLAEYLWDERRYQAFANDIFVGVRIGLNDIQGTEILFGDIADFDQKEHLTFIELSRRIGQTGKLDLTVRLFDGAEPSAEPELNINFSELDNDDYLSLSYTHFF